jgi:hypothetical protein
MIRGIVPSESGKVSIILGIESSCEDWWHTTTITLNSTLDSEILWEK